MTLEKGKGAVQISIQDEGGGFDWEDYLEMQPERAFDNHGRGIALANGTCFETLEYSGNGNKVTVLTACEPKSTERVSHRGRRAAA